MSDACSGKSSGGILKRNGEFYLIDRKFEPFGWAGFAGHVEPGENPKDTAEREALEEIHLPLSVHHLLFSEKVLWNYCWKSKDAGHYWDLFAMNDPGGDPIPNSEEAKGGGWFKPEEIQHLELEPVWRYFFEKLEIIKP